MGWQELAIQSIDQASNWDNPIRWPFLKRRNFLTYVCWDIRVKIWEMERPKARQSLEAKLRQFPDTVLRQSFEILMYPRYHRLFSNEYR